MVSAAVQEGSRSWVRIWAEGPHCGEPCRFLPVWLLRFWSSGTSGLADAEAALTADQDQEVRSSRILDPSSGSGSGFCPGPTPRSGLQSWTGEVGKVWKVQADS